MRAGSAIRLCSAVVASAAAHRRIEQAAEPRLADRLSAATGRLISGQMDQGKHGIPRVVPDSSQPVPDSSLF